MDRICSKYVLSEPYPQAADIRPDPRIARRLLNEYAGATGELSAVTQYLYNSMLASAAGYGAIGDLFSCVSMVEMHHLKLIGELILAYGGDPGYMSYGRNGRPQWWSGSFVDYAKDPAAMLRAAIKGQREAIMSYRQTAASMTNASARALIERIITDEEHHIALFTDALAGIPMPLNDSARKSGR